MRHRSRTKHFNRTPSHRRAMLRNMAASLLKTDGGSDNPDNPGRIITTPQKAKACRRLVEKVITLGKKGGLANFRRALALLGDKEMVHKVFAEIAPRYASRQGGYTRILHLAEVRLGDAASQCIFELVEEEIAHKPRRAKAPKRQTAKPAAKEMLASDQEAQKIQAEGGREEGEPGAKDEGDQEAAE